MVTYLCIFMIKQDLFVALINTKWFREFSPIMHQKGLMRWHPSGVTRTRVIGVNFSEILFKGKEI